jgi:SSS family solute:Na+ symporter
MNGNASSEISLVLILFGVVAGLPSVRADTAGSSISDGVNDTIHQKALLLLRTALQKEDRWIKVHAAESLLSLGHSEGIRQAFELELSAKGGEPKYRIGIWRVLAQAAPDAAEREQWIGKIRAAFLDPTGPDRLHAAEALAKLGYQVQNQEADAFKLVAETGDDRLAAETRWIFANNGAMNPQLSLAELLESKEDLARFNAAYALRNLPQLSAAAREKLLAALSKEPAHSSGRIYMISAALVHAPPDQQKQLKAELLSHVKTGDQAAKYEICATLAKVGLKEDLPLLSSLLDDTNSDVRVGAANAVLWIEQRNTHSGL